MKKGQAEMFGLIILVVILAIGFLVYIRLSFNSTNDVRAVYEESQFGQAFVTTVIRSEVRDLACGDETHELGLLLRAFAESDKGPCTNVAAVQRVVNLEIQTILAGSLDRWERPYRLTFRTDTELLTFVGPPDTDGCEEGGRRLPAGSQFIPTNAGVAELLIEQCE